MDLKIEYMELEKLKPYEKNNKKHEDYDIGEIAKSIGKYGMIDPIGIWGKDNIIVEGHGRLEACKKLGIDKVPVIRLDHLTDEQRREYAIVHNKSQELALWDFDNIAEELAEIDLSDFELDFDMPEQISSDDFDESSLDRQNEKTSVIVSLHCQSIKDYENIKERLENIKTEINATMAVKMI